MARVLNDVGWPITLTPRGFVGGNNLYELVSPAISPSGFENLNTLPFFAALATYDVAKARRMHPATLWGGLLLFLFQPLFVLLYRQLVGA